MAEAEACEEVGWLSLAGECPIPLLSPGEPTIDEGDVNVRSSINISLPVV